MLDSLPLHFRPAPTKRPTVVSWRGWVRSNGKGDVRQLGFASLGRRRGWQGQRRAEAH